MANKLVIAALSFLVVFLLYLWFTLPKPEQPKTFSTQPIQIEPAPFRTWLPLLVFITVAVILIYFGTKPKEITANEYWEELWR